MKTLRLVLLFTIVNTAWAQVPELHKECFTGRRGRSCVRLGTTLWQNPSTRDAALQAFKRGCELKEESACTLKNLKTEIAKAPLKAREFHIERAKALGYASDLDKTLNGATMEPDRNSDKTVRGYRFVSIEAGSVFSTLGFNKGDIITHANDQPMTSPTDATALLPTLIYTDRYEVKFQRDGRSLTNTYILED